MGFEPKKDCVKTDFVFRKLKFMGCSRVPVRVFTHSETGARLSLQK